MSSLLLFSIISLEKIYSFCSNFSLLLISRERTKYALTKSLFNFKAVFSEDFASSNLSKFLKIAPRLQYAFASSVLIWIAFFEDNSASSKRLRFLNAAHKL